MDTDMPQADNTVLYVEDELVNVMLMRVLMERRPQWRLEVATTGQQALALATQIRPVLLLLDLRLPDCWGGDLLTLLRREAGWQAVPAVAVTAETGFQATAGNGFLEVWRKPINLQRTLSRMDALLGPQAVDPLASAPRPGPALASLGMAMALAAQAR